MVYITLYALSAWETCVLVLSSFWGWWHMLHFMPTFTVLVIMEYPLQEDGPVLYAGT